MLPEGGSTEAPHTPHLTTHSCKTGLHTCSMWLRSLLTSDSQVVLHSQRLIDFPKDIMYHAHRLLPQPATARPQRGHGQRVSWGKPGEPTRSVPCCPLGSLSRPCPINARRLPVFAARHLHLGCLPVCEPCCPAAFTKSSDYYGGNGLGLFRPRDALKPASSTTPASSCSTRVRPGTASRPLSRCAH